MNCPLCISDNAEFFFEEAGVQYSECRECQLIFMHPEFRLSLEEERQRYLLHENSPNDSRYREFLKPTHSCVVQNLPMNSEGLDFGCGPGPTLSVMLRESSYHVWDYDPLFFPEASSLQRGYDFVTCTEVFEHLFCPADVIARLVRLTREGGWIFVKTEIFDGSVSFRDWYYRRDPTHVCFYRKASMNWIAAHWGLEYSEFQGVSKLEKPRL